MNSTEITRLLEQLVYHLVNDERSVSILGDLIVSKEEEILIGTWSDLHLIFSSSSLSCKLLICAAFLPVDVVDDLRDGVADTDACCGPRDGLTLLVNEANKLTAFVVWNGNVLLCHVDDI